jgi:hypothetical protein
MKYSVEIKARGHHPEPEYEHTIHGSIKEGEIIKFIITTNDAEEEECTLFPPILHHADVAGMKAFREATRQGCAFVTAGYVRFEPDVSVEYGSPTCEETYGRDVRPTEADQERYTRAILEIIDQIRSAMGRLPE